MLLNCKLSVPLKISCRPLCTSFLFVLSCHSQFSPPHLTFHPHRKEDVKEADTEKEAAMEAELRAARERAIVPLEARMTQFREMLLERGVSKCSDNRLWVPFF